MTMAHFQPQGGSMYGETAGTRFRATGLTAFHWDNPNGAYTETVVNRYHFVGQGGIQFRIFGTAPFTVNANGEVTADFENLVDECK
ncbi:MAG: hypothetical protein J5I98_08015 [Phaeodactylibacter sp.]|nr:hypothetical protein [Phaeodactylibacter sp.]